MPVMTRPASARSGQAYPAKRARLLVPVAALAGAVLSIGAASTAQPPGEMRCGWFINPSPANVWLVDRHDGWIVGTQGGHQASGDWPKFAEAEWVRFGAANYGYGCACLRVQADAKTKRVHRIFAASARPLAVCRGDPAIKGKEPGALEK